ncbi:glycosyltransferase [Curtobacterium sp. MCBD17_019]|uniref:glycosyltransferase n=1 Tax=Curtobacterium sp. MCBD17_019 TaxID=2175669 RepID=UPI0011B4C484|nr:glycosyltransferase [Curtobacterium sp. MCBD17_019]
MAPFLPTDSRRVMAIRRLVGFAVLPVVGGLAPLVAVPAIAARFGAEGWRDVAVGQSIGAAAAVVVELGWGISGPQRSARQSLGNLRRSVGLALVTQALVLLPVTAGVWVVAHLVSVGAPALVGWIGTAGALGSVNVVWCWIGLGRPGPILWADTLPRTLPVVVAAVALAAGAPLWVFPLALVVSGLVPVVLGTTLLGIGPATLRQLTPRLVVRAVRIQLQPLLGRVLSATYISVPITLAGVSAPGAVAVFAAADRLQRWALTALKALPTALQGWVGGPADPDRRIRRAWVALWGNVGVGVLVGAGFVVVVPAVSRAFFAGVATVAPDLAVLSGLLVVVVTTSRATGGLVLVALRGVPAITLSAAAGCLVGVPGVLVLARVDGARGAMLGVLSAEAAVLAVQVVAVVVLDRRRRRRVRRATSVLRVAHVRVDDPAYPRNARVRHHLRAAGFTVDVVRRHRGGSVIGRMTRDARTVLGLRGYDVHLLAEMSLVVAPLVALVARLRGGVVVVDRFVGQYETDIDDHGLAAPRSLRALRCRVVDRLAERSADVLLIDTEVRAAALRERVPARTAVLSLPVGAPAWAVPPTVTPAEAGAKAVSRADVAAGAAAGVAAGIAAGAGAGAAAEAGTLPSGRAAAASGPLRVLFYGQDVPLHGVPVIVSALGEVGRPIRATFVSYASVLERIRAQLHDEGDRVDATLLEPVPAEELATVIANHDVVLGVFGTSDKARSVIPNKVWQGLACGRTVITAASPALAELRPLVGPQLVEVPPGDAEALAGALRAVVDGPVLSDGPWVGTAERLEAYAAARHERFAALLRQRCAARAGA